MTYCVAIKLNAGLVFLSDSRTNAGLDQISSFRKMMIYEKTGDRFMVLQPATRVVTASRTAAERSACMGASKQWAQCTARLQRLALAQKHAQQTCVSVMSGF